MKEHQINELLVRHKFEKSENDFSRLSVEYEEAAVRRVREGDINNICFLNYEDFKDKMGATASTPKKTFEYNTVAAITLFSRAAIEGGAKPEDAYDLGEVLLQQLERAKSIREVHEIFQLAEIMFAKMVHRVRAMNKPYQVEKCRTYIGENIYRRITVEEIARTVGRNPHYLSRLFFEYERITLKDYIQREKMDSACHMLRFSSQSIAEIALRFGYKSQSKFTEVFRKWQGMTPTEYRNLNYHTAAE